MKTQLRILSLAFFLGSCSAPDDSTTPAQETGPRLSWAKGMKWKKQAKQVSTRSGTHLLQGDSLVPCDYDWDYDGTCSPKAERVLTTKTVSYVEVTAATRIVSFDAPGFVIAETSATEIEISPDPYNDNQNNVQLGSRLYVLVPHNGFVVRLENDPDSWWMETSDSDATKGQTLYPMSPRVGSVYSDDRGTSWRAETTEILDVEGQKITTTVVEYAAIKTLPIDWVAFQTECFSIVPYYNDYSRLVFVDSCDDVLIETSGKQWIAGGHLVKEEYSSKYFRVADYGWVSEWGYVSSYTDTPTEEYVIFVEEIAETQSMEILEFITP